MNPGCRVQDQLNTSEPTVRDTNRAVHYRPRIKSQKTARSVGVEPTTFRTAAIDDDKD